ncbi:MAG: hypothetical protein PHV68_05250 [Candidatus Gastranaerophilales bacterium]|nr:hypothetical protein [Candidatus Gastranaerophilales bacterium]
MATLLALGPKMKTMWNVISGTFDQSTCEEAGGVWNEDANACVEE